MLTSFKVAVFDVDGVLALPAEPFSRFYARERGLDSDAFKAFFKGDFQGALVGTEDLRQLIAKHNDVWQLEEGLDDLLTRWFEKENVRNEPLLEIVEKLRAAGVPCYLATNQERHRGAYIREHMFKNEFDGYFVSAHIGALKPQREFFKAVIANIQTCHPLVEPGDIIFFDDSAEHVEAAKSLGINGHLYVDFAEAATLLGGEH